MIDLLRLLKIIITLKFITILKAIVRWLKKSNVNSVQNIIVSAESFNRLLDIRSKMEMPDNRQSTFIILNMDYIATIQNADLLAWCKQNLKITMSDLITPTWFFIMKDNKT